LKAIKEGKDKGAPSIFKKTDKTFLLIWAILIFVFFSISSSKLIPYIAPIFLPIAVTLGHLFRLYEDRRVILKKATSGRLLYHLPIILQSLFFIILLLLPPFLRNMRLGEAVVIAPSEKWWGLIILPILFQAMIIFLPDLVKRVYQRGWFLTVYLLLAFFLGSLVFPIADFLTPYKSSYPFTQAIKAFLPRSQELFQFGTSLYGIDFYSKIRTPIVGYSGELEFGIEQLPSNEKSRYFLSLQEFFNLCQQKGDIYCMTRSKKNVEELKRNVSVVEILWDNGEFYLLRLRG
jgi:4-amino-4-deoxy-L-arabinose transferase-like glycosyltransferase